MAKLTVEVVTADRQVLTDEDVDMVVAPGSEGVVGILPRHAPLLTTLGSGAIRIRKGNTESEMAVSGGFLQVNRDRVLILADTAEREDEIDESRAQAARERAERTLREAQAAGRPADIATARLALGRSAARLNVVRRKRRPNTL
ncbi:MAG: F0F1 ATP synthase subunit epsilon [Chloroflexota bacterium]